jgi:biotin-(acetyl-CoA carboxylase) ligase
VSRADLLDALCLEMDRRLDALRSASPAVEWAARSGASGRLVEVSTPVGPVRGAALGIDDWGDLVVRTAVGDVAHVPAAACLELREVR